MKKKRLDLLMVEKGIAESRNQAQRLIMAGEVLVNNNLAMKASETYVDEVEIQLKGMPPFLSRGGEKLERALQHFELENLEGAVCADVGASTGGFTDCLLQHGAARVYAMDVGYGQLHWKLRNDPRVIVMEKTNIRDVTELPEQMDIVVVDVSFISLRAIMPVLINLMKSPSAALITLIKPQFEAGRKEAAKGKGVITDRAIHQRVIEDVIDTARVNRLYLHGLTQSPLKGPKGNIEFLAFFKLYSLPNQPEDLIYKMLETKTRDE